MDNKAFSTLDPKLKETFDRVMGTNVSQPAQPQNGHQSDTIPTVNSSAAPAPIPPVEETAPVQMPVTSPQETPKTVIKIEPTPAPKHTEDTKKTSPQTAVKTSMVIPAVFIILGVVFFALYAVFWMQFFNVALPI